MKKKISESEFGKICDYNDMEIELTKTVFPVVVGTLGMVKENFNMHNKKIAGNPIFI